MPIFEINRFRKARLSAKMTQSQAAEKIGVDPITIIQWEKGSNIPTKRNLEKAARVYGCTTNDLLEPNAASAVQTNCVHQNSEGVPQ